MSQPIQTMAGAQVVPCPDGKHRVGLQSAIGPAQFTVIIEPEQADLFAEQLAAGIRQAGADARRANSGIILPTTDPLPEPARRYVDHLDGMLQPTDAVPPALRGRRNGHG